jgi:hypothetical protein
MVYDAYSTYRNAINQENHTSRNSLESVRSFSKVDKNIRD